ncbi:uncharacterized protein PITG_10910 [Phytophthora infestans T30-4]|uniref:Uncharacterized protein n=1 Tax=Phytophthora infestans (strain T30-4) TaxID=403677 RepID=D0NHD4_PHYIT|nr:uncharacterized protein PITG_10910 [Phytophthora infestans T30-4]EEY58773.1 conserved hypothetical protein [Phytophthora infestans T30-4]|eukprot:XP_002901717.1 conserved hypothetical protein [Phytophthora infestans T30-4]
MPTKYRRYTLYTKLRVLEAARNGLDWEAVAGDNNVNLSTACNWVQRYPNFEDVISPAPRGGKTAQKMTPACVKFPQDQLATDPDLTLRQLADMLETSLCVTVRPQTVKNHLDAALSTMKQFHKEPQYMNTAQNKLKRRDYLIQLQRYQAALLSREQVTLLRGEQSNPLGTEQGLLVGERRRVLTRDSSPSLSLLLVVCIDGGSSVHRLSPGASTRAASARTGNPACALSKDES